MNFLIYCHIFPHICIILVVITNVFNDLGDFLNNFLSSSFNSVRQKTPSVSTFNITGATGLEKGQTQRARFGNFETHPAGQRRPAAQ
jgi:hypothetical protein